MNTAENVISTVIDTLRDFIQQVWEAAQPIIDWVRENIELKDVLIAIGIVIASIVIPALIGKFFMNLIVAYSGRFSVQIIRGIFGVEGDWISALIGVILAAVLLVAVFIIMFKVDWEKHFEKYATKEKNGDRD